ncbi:hypothetical protein ACTXT7_001755 [Hymenolepis weldensis]
MSLAIHSTGWAMMSIDLLTFAFDEHAFNVSANLTGSHLNEFTLHDSKNYFDALDDLPNSPLPSMCIRAPITDMCFF